MERIWTGIRRMAIHIRFIKLPDSCRKLWTSISNNFLKSQSLFLQAFFQKWPWSFLTSFYLSNLKLLSFAYHLIQIEVHSLISKHAALILYFLSGFYEQKWVGKKSGGILLSRRKNDCSLRPARCLKLSTNLFKLIKMVGSVARPSQLPTLLERERRVCSGKLNPPKFLF